MGWSLLGHAASGLLGHIINSVFSYLKDKNNKAELDEIEKVALRKASYRSFVTHTVITLCLLIGTVYFSESFKNDTNLFMSFSHWTSLSMGWWFGSLTEK